MLFSFHAYAKPLYVRLESDGDLIFSNSPILDTPKPETSPKNKARVADAEVTKENIDHTHHSKINTKPIPVEVAKDKINNQPSLKIIPISLPNEVPIIAAVTEEKIHASQQSKNISSLLKNMPMSTETTKENINNKHGSKVIHMSLPNNIPIIAAATEETLHVSHKPNTLPKPGRPLEKISILAESTEENLNDIMKPSTDTKAIIRPKNKSVLVDIGEENLIKTKNKSTQKNKLIVAKTHKNNKHNDHKPQDKKKLATSLKDKSIAAKNTKEHINITHTSNTKTKLTLPKHNPIMAKTKKENINKKHPSNTIDKELTYKTFRITSPLNKEVIQNLSSILIDLKVEPKLQHDHKIQLFVDGRRLKPSSSTHINTDIAKKGAHEIYGLIIDKNKNFVVQSNVITVYIREANMKTSSASHIIHHKIAKKTLTKKVFLANSH